MRAKLYTTEHLGLRVCLFEKNLLGSVIVHHNTSPSHPYDHHTQTLPKTAVSGNSLHRDLTMFIIYNLDCGAELGLLLRLWLRLEKSWSKHGDSFPPKS